MTTEDNRVKAGSVVNRPWGCYRVVMHEDNYSVKVLYIKPGHETSLQRHSKRHELVTLLDGVVEIHLQGHIFYKNNKCDIGASYRIPAMEWHKLAAPASQNTPTIVLEVAYGELDPDDFERKEDRYNRVRKKGPGFKG